ncbi:Curli production assembly/transport component CsgG [Ectothiorhodosinus mongolicus]|uniref:Curli production assembly/transport component CsgG n=1 Tax=Ectothiorhodosinus mongolicus TaxID=233100 RepID=A0A1R3W496_9GAMM|nr:CsgG/HfaB family protein [Ectothiorhodosinus mongolicus]ULX57483.1 hypothetical protein CKX93_07255 [Ectothiorhodosinus mongolicus]SIT72420.1 Curli production assembly/transport component CsgG [Ectothiorhodosinus mongolicus]
MSKNIACLMILGVALFWFHSATASGLTEITVTGEGTGPTEEIATRNALANAVSQTGLSISIDSVLDTTVARSASSGGAETMSAQQRRSETTSLQAEGEIKSWRKISSRRIEGSLYSVQVSAVLHHFEQGPSAQRMRIALLPVEARGSGISANHLRELEAEIQKHLVQSRRFAVLTRSDINRVLSEQNFIANQNVSRGERARLGNLLGADVLLLVNVSEAYYSERTETVAVTGQIRVIKNGAVRINVNIIDAATGQIRFSNSYATELGRPASSMGGMLSTVATNSIADVVQRIYPLRIIQITDGGNVFLNAGGSMLRPGMTFTVYSEGEALVDPYTGESLGGAEQEIGVIEVTRVESRFSVAKIRSGEGFQEMMIARPTSAAIPGQRSQAPAEAPRANTGVALPFDR